MSARRSREMTPLAQGKARQAAAWVRAYMECLREGRAHSLVRTYWQMRGLLV